MTRKNDVAEIKRLLAALTLPKGCSLPQPTLELAASTMMSDLALPDEVVEDTLTVLRAMQVGKQWGEWQMVLFPFLPLAMADSSDNYRLPAPARNLIYGLRKLTNLGAAAFDTARQKYITDGSDKRPSLVQSFIEKFPTVAANWPAILRDPRGTFTQPHDHPTIQLGTKNVERYLADIATTLSAQTSMRLPQFAVSANVVGPTDIYSAALLIEKETFIEVLEADGIQDRQDLALMSGKGFINDAGKDLIDVLLKTLDVLGLFDFDLNGIRMGQHLEARGGVWIGLTWEDIVYYGLEDLGEAVSYFATGDGSGGKIAFDPRGEFEDAGLDEEAVEFLCDTVTYKTDGKVASASGRRVELNALSAAQLIDLIERKLVDHDIGKAIPNDDGLRLAFKRMKLLTMVNRLIAKFEAVQIDDPDLDALREQIEEGFDEDATQSWVEVARGLVKVEVDKAEFAAAMGATCA